MRWGDPIRLPGAAVLALLLTSDASAANPNRGGFDLSRPEIQTFIVEVAARDELKPRQLRSLLAKAVPQPKIIELIGKPAERVLAWWEYREHFLTEKRIAQGAAFWQEHREALERIAAERGIPPEYIIGILGCETFYGTITGRFRVLDALATLAFDYPPRGEFFRKELEQFVLLIGEEKIDPLTALGSYTGAMGVVQFMPSNYRALAIDEDGDGKRDLWNDWEDAMASIANYLRKHGWQPGEPVLAEVDLDPDPIFQIDPRNLKIDTTLAALNAQGVRARTDLPGTTPALLISAEENNGPAYRIGFENFAVIMRYNHSARYAMAVHDLAQAVLARVRAARP